MSSIMQEKDRRTLSEIQRDWDIFDQIRPFDNAWQKLTSENKVRVCERTLKYRMARRAALIAEVARVEEGIEEERTWLSRNAGVSLWPLQDSFLRYRQERDLIKGPARVELRVSTGEVLWEAECNSISDLEVVAFIAHPKKSNRQP